MRKLLAVSVCLAQTLVALEGTTRSLYAQDAQAETDRVVRDNDLAPLLGMPEDFWGCSGLAGKSGEAG